MKFIPERALAADENIVSTSGSLSETKLYKASLMPSGMESLYVFASQDIYPFDIKAFTEAKLLKESFSDKKSGDIPLLPNRDTFNKIYFSLSERGNTLKNVL